MFPSSFGIAREGLPNACGWASIFCSSATFMRAMLARFRSQVHDPIGYPNEQRAPLWLPKNVPGRCKEETHIDAKRPHYRRMLLDDATIVAVGTQWRTRKGWTNESDRGRSNP